MGIIECMQGSDKLPRNRLQRVCQLKEKRGDPQIEQQGQAIVERRNQRPRSYGRINPQAAKNQRHHSTQSPPPA